MYLLASEYNLFAFPLTHTHSLAKCTDYWCVILSLLMIILYCVRELFDETHSAEDEVHYIDM